ncbi:hypothetical protein D9M69_632990 [compost metagenome]
MGEVVVADETPAALARRRVQGQGLGPLHVRAEAADPDDRRTVALDRLEGQGLAVGAGQGLDRGLDVGHGGLLGLSFLAEWL